jgi:hypothetical protein
MNSISLTEASIGYDLRACDQPVHLSQEVTEVSFDHPEEGYKIVEGDHATILAALHAAGYSAHFSESERALPGGFLKLTAAKALPES